MPKDNVLKVVNTFHRSLIRLTFGKKGWNMAGMPVVKLTTVGRKSGKGRTVMLTSPIQLEDEIILVASRGGDDQHPDWFLNLERNPLVTVETLSDMRTMFAEVSKSPEREKLWLEIIKNYPNYAAYQDKTDRLIPVIVLKGISD